LVTVQADPEDLRSRLPVLTEAGRDLLVAAVPVWRETHDEVDARLWASKGELRGDLDALCR